MGCHQQRGDFTPNIFILKSVGPKNAEPCMKGQVCDVTRSYGSSSHTVTLA